MSWGQKWGSRRKVGRELERDLVSPRALALKCRTLSWGGDTLAVTSRIAAVHLHLPALPCPPHPIPPPQHTHVHTQSDSHTHADSSLVGKSVKGYTRIGIYWVAYTCTYMQTYTQIYIPILTHSAPPQTQHRHTYRHTQAHTAHTLPSVSVGALSPDPSPCAALAPCLTSSVACRAS